MSAALVDLSIEQGSLFSRLLTFKDASKALVDLTGWSFQGQIRSAFDATDVIGTFTFVIADQVDAKGQVTMSLLPNALTALSLKKLTKYLYDINATVSVGVVYRVMQGQALISPEVTR